MMRQLNTELTDELDRIWELRKANNDLTIEEIRAVPCPTCGAERGKKCESLGVAPFSPHRDRHFTAENLLSR
jgi:hypothetical protein